LVEARQQAEVVLLESFEMSLRKLGLLRNFLERQTSTLARVLEQYAKTDAATTQIRKGGVPVSVYRMNRGHGR
jgi:hypothetical protein